MSRYYFHVRTSGDLIRDPDGTELPNLENARAEAILDARAAMSVAILEGRDISSHTSVEICDESGKLLMTVPYRAAIRPDAGADI